MAVAYNATSSNGSDTAGQTSISTTHTAAGSDRAVVVGLSFRRQTSDVTDITVTYDGAAMTQIGTIIGPGTNVSAVALFGLLNPSTTAGATVAAAWTNGQSWTEIGVVSFTGAGSFGTPVTQVSGSSSTPSVTIVCTANDMVIDTLATSGGSPNSAAGGQTERWERVATTAFLGAGQTAAGGVSVAMSWTLGAADQTNLMGVAVVAVASGPANLKSLDTNVKANIKSYNTNVLANIKSIDTNA